MTYCRAEQSPSPKSHLARCAERPLHMRGFTIVELIVVMAILGILTTLAIPTYTNMKNKARSARAIAEIRELEKVINAFSIEKAGTFPNTLDELQQASFRDLKDPWGNPYIYTNILNPTGPQEYDPREDPSTNKLNTDFDLFSKGADGNSLTLVTDPASQDDIVRGGDGGFVGLARDYFPAE